MIQISDMKFSYPDGGFHLDVEALYIGPKKTGGDKAKNWIETVPGKGWFPYFRFYSPAKPFLDKTRILPDIEKAK